jgi:transporter family-2 protein
LSRGLAVVLTVLVGALIALQAPVNSRLGKAVGTLPAAAASFALGLAVLVVLASLAEGWGRLGEVRHVGPLYLTGGILGAAYVVVALLAVRSLGAGGVVAATIAGQLAMAVVIDQLGLLGVARHPTGALRLLGVALLVAGTYLVVRR